MSVRTNAGFLDSVPIGCGMDWFTDTAPTNWAICDGRALSRTEYSELFKVLGTKFGIGDGTTTFNIPDFRGRIGVGKSTDSEFNTLGKKVGNKTTTINVKLPKHTHRIRCYEANVDNNILSHPGRGGWLIGNNQGEYGNWEGDRIESTGIDNIDAAQNYTISNIQPSLVENKIIKIK